MRSSWLRAAAASARSAVSAGKCRFARRQASAAACSSAARVLASRSAAPAFSALSAASSASRRARISGIVADHPLLADDVVGELREPAVELVLAGADAAGFLLELRLGDRQALEGGRGGGFRLAQFRQLMGGDALLLGGLHLRAALFGRPVPWPVASAERPRLPRLGLRPADMQQRRLALRMSADSFLKREAWRAWRFRLSIWLSSSPTTSSSRSRLCSAALSRSSASWRRECRPEMPAASSSSARRACGLAWISSPIRPCPTIEGERAPVDGRRKATARPWRGLPCR